MPQLRQTSLVDPTGQPKLPDDILDGDKKCESCGQPGSPVHCSGCSALDVGSFCIRYCSAHCQMAHWEKHKEKCHAYRRLLRALRVVVPIWDHFLRLTRTTNVKFAGFDGNVIHLKPSKTTEGVDPRAWTGESLFHPFPDDNVSGTLCEKVELALLHDCRCDDIIAVCFSLINTFLQPVCSEIWEETIKVKGPALQVILANQPRGTSTHTVLRVVLPGDDRLIIDLTGMQYGWEERIYHVEAYRQYRGETMGSYKFEAVDVERDQLQDYGPNTLPWVIYSFQKALARAIDEALAAFFTAVKVSPDVFLFKSKKVFDKQCVKLIDHVKRTMEAEANDLRVRRGIGRLYLEVTPPKLLVKAVGGVGMQEILNKVWFNHEEVEKTEGNEQALILEWIARCERAVSQ